MSKYVAEDYVISNGGIALRYFNVFGPGEEHKGSMASFLYQALIKLRESQLVKLFPKEPRRDFVYIDDVISANIFAFENFDKLDKNYYEVSTGIASRFERVLEIAHINFEYSSEKEIPEGYQFYTCGNPERWMPGWQPKFSLESGVIDFLSKLSDSIDGRESQT